MRPNPAACNSGNLDSVDKSVDIAAKVSRAERREGKNGVKGASKSAGKHSHITRAAQVRALETDNLKREHLPPHRSY